MSSSSHPILASSTSSSSLPLPQDRIVVGVGGTVVDYLATVDAFPNPDDKIPSTICAPFLHANKRRAFILPLAFMLKILSLYFSMLVQMLLQSGNENPFLSFASCRNIPILVDAEKKRDGLDELLNFADYVAWTESPSIPSALVSMLMILPNLKFVIVTLGDDGCIMLERSLDGSLQPEEVDVDSSLQLLKQLQIHHELFYSNYLFLHLLCQNIQSVVSLSAKGIGAVNGRLLVGTAEKIPPSELIDTTGAGDAFIGATLYAICAGMPPEKMLPFASQVAGASCRALGARTGLPWRTDPRITPHLL
ncbi:hypothetical protein MKW92_051042 [Papaver armeniacum]|nr:hypothetical protein MKW92_051042 [Papaver armeniacum]